MVRRMIAKVKKVATSCWRASTERAKYSRMKKDDDGGPDEKQPGSGRFNDWNEPSIWTRDLREHFCGQLSFAVLPGNVNIEDYNQVETGHNATFVGIYDGHGGDYAARFVVEHLFDHFIKEVIRANKTISEEVIRRAISGTEDGFIMKLLGLRRLDMHPEVFVSGTCCLVGVICQGTIYIANLGDSRVVLGTYDGPDNIVAVQLSTEHNANRAEIREELQRAHPDDPNIVPYVNGAYRVKGIIQVTRSIGDAYLKRADLAVGREFPRFHLREPLKRPVLSAEPSIAIRAIQPGDRFLIFASDGLWDLLSNEEAVQFVQRNPRDGIAQRLVWKAMTKAVIRSKKVKTMRDLIRMDRTKRREQHDDISVVVVFLDRDSAVEPPVKEVSIKSYLNNEFEEQISLFSKLHEEESD